MQDNLIDKLDQLFQSEENDFVELIRNLTGKSGRQLSATVIDFVPRVFSADDPLKLSGILNEFATSLMKSARYTEAEPLYREALEIDRQTLGTQHPDYATHLNNLAGLLDATGRFEAAEPLFREALEIDRQTVGTQHPSYAIDLNNLAWLLQATGRYDDAEPLFREAVAVMEAALGAEHPDAQTTRENLESFLAEHPA